MVSSYASSSKPNTKASERSSQTGTAPRFFCWAAAFSTQPSPEKGFVQVCFLLWLLRFVRVYLNSSQMDRVLYCLGYSTENAHQCVSSQSIFLEQKSWKRTKDTIRDANISDLHWFWSNFMLHYCKWTKLLGFNRCFWSFLRCALTEKKHN